MKKNIVFFIDSMGKGGAERVVSILANSFSQNNNVYIITNVYGESGYELDKNIKLDKSYKFIQIVYTCKKLFQ